MFYKYKDAPRVKERENRYRGLRILRDLESKDELLESYERKQLPIGPDDYYHTVQVNEEYRLDLIAYKHYGNALLWWVIASANNITDPLSGPRSGDVVRVPSVSTLYSNGGVLL